MIVSVSVCVYVCVGVCADACDGDDSFNDDADVISLL